MQNTPATDLIEAVNRLKLIRHEIDLLKTTEADLSAHIASAMSEQIAAQLAGKDYGCGTANIKLNDGLLLKFDIGKNVKWDQAGLGQLREAIAASGRDPFEFISVKYDVAENAYKNWPSEIRAPFEPLRTVSQTKTKISIVEK